MGGVSEVVLRRVRQIARPLSRYGDVAGTYLFGSYVWGVPDPESDIDVAAFVDGVESWDMRRRAAVIAEIQRLVGDDVELHLFPADSLKDPPSASLARLVVEKGLRVEGDTGREP